MHDTCVGDPYGTDRDAGQLDHLALQEFKTGVAQILLRQFLQNFAGVWSCDAEHADIICDVDDVHVVATVCGLRLYPPGFRTTEKTCHIALTLEHRHLRYWLK